ncbi:MAG: anaerobic ribonucleoside-triphosphate reductase activating protein [Candidatus Latescibacterota bacterium]
MERKSFWDIPVAGVQAMTAIDFPGRLACVLFTRGCPWKCRYCHNDSLRFGGECMSWEDIEMLLRERVGYLEGVVISGGEPTLHPELRSLLSWIRELGFAVAIHTNGFYPDMLRRILRKNLVDYVAMDIKAPPAAYQRITQNENACIEVSRSINVILESGVDYEFRTTWHPSVLSENELMETMRTAAKIGIKTYYLQKFNGQGVSDRELVDAPSRSFPPAILDEARSLFPVFDVR